MTLCRAALLLVAVSGCGELTDGLGHCVESTPDWWPLEDGIWWQYAETDFQQPAIALRKDLNVEHERSRVGGLLGDEHGVRTWRADWEEETGAVKESGWRWFLDSGTSFAFRRDIWTVPEQKEIPCPTQGPDADPAQCDVVTPNLDVYYLPARTRLDYSDDRICERSAWDVTFIERTIAVGVPYIDYPDLEPCPLDTWRNDPADCQWEDSEHHETWDIQYVDRTIEVPAGRFEHCLCARRRGENDKTYCFAKDVGKVFELDRTRTVECLAQYTIDGETVGTPPGEAVVCDPTQVEDYLGPVRAD